ncbi:MAG: hypothetical protein AAB340_01265 [Patescibacteria group bacterium]
MKKIFENDDFLIFFSQGYIEVKRKDKFGTRIRIVPSKGYEVSANGVCMSIACRGGRIEPDSENSRIVDIFPEN